MHITELLKNLNLQMLCECGASFPWPSASAEHRRLPAGGLNFCPSCGYLIREFQPTPEVLKAAGMTPQFHKPDPILGQTGRDAMVGESAILRSVNRGMLGPLG
jgi:hypothetical protein